MRSRFFLFSLLAAAAFAQTRPAPVISPEVHADRTVTVRLRAPGAKEVLFAREGAKPVPMEKNDEGIWTLTTPPLEPDVYGYSFLVDGVNLYDPSNPRIKPNLLYQSSVVHVPGPASLPWEVNDVPRGELHQHFYKSAIIGDQRDYFVYTPPAYDPKSKKPYPVLYLLHGYSDTATAWTSVGRAHVTLDNLIAQGKVRPMLVVMPLGYGAPEIVSRTAPPFRDPNLRQKNFDRFRDALFNEVMPRVEKAYRVSTDRNGRAIAGLSMGGAESLYTGLNAIDRFAWIGAFSSGGLGDNFEASFKAVDAKSTAKLRLLWVACGVDDGLIGFNRKFDEWLKSKDIHHQFIETPGAHTWMVWRRNLAEFTPLLFR